MTATAPPPALPPSVPPTGPTVAPRAALLDTALNAPDTAFTRWLVRWRFVFFAFLAVLILAQFNGQWRMGLDSSIYRGVADSLAQGNGYKFVGRKQTQIYPGFPFLLAALQRGLHTTSTVPPLVLLNALALLTLAGVYQLIKLRYPLWIAVAVTCGVGMNERFIQQAQELMTDLPFLCAVVAAMLGWEWLAVVRGRGRVAAAVGLLTGGLFVAATMRPTFWVLATAWAAVAVWNAVVRRERRSIIALIGLAVAGLAFVALDPRIRGLSLLQGSYEKELFQNLSGLSSRLAKNAPNLFHREFPEAFFGEVMSYVAPPFTLLIFAGAYIVTRRQPAWGLQVFILTGVMLMLSDVPRYYLMVLPTLWLGYVLATLVLTVRLPLAWRDLTLFALFSIANLQNLSGYIPLFIEQHAKNFQQNYKRGVYEPYRAMAAVLKTLPPGATIVGPNAQVLAYLSGRDVVNGRLLNFESTPVLKYPAKLAAATPTYLIGPLDLYERKDLEMYRLLAAGVIVPGKLVANIAKSPFWLAEATVQVPAGDWRKLPTVRRLRPTGPSTRPSHTPEEMARRTLKAQRERKQIRNARAAHAEHMAKQTRKQRKQRRTTTAPAARNRPDDETLPCFASAEFFPSMTPHG